MNEIIIKNKQQIDGIRKSCKLAAETLDYIEEFVAEGITTEELNNIAAKFIKDNGATSAPLNYKGFPKETCISINEVICHGIPDQTVLKNGDILNIDITTILDGFYGDTSRMFTVGEINETAKKLVRTTKECLMMSIETVKPQSMLSGIAKVITQHAESNGFSVVNAFCGHGVGLEFHEPPFVQHDYKSVKDGFLIRLEEGMIFTIEPMLCEGERQAMLLEDNWTAITTDKKLSAQFEHTVLVTKDGYEIMTEN